MEVFVTGGTGYIGCRLIPALLERGHQVRALTRATSAGRVPQGAQAVIGDALDASSYAHTLQPGDTLVHLVGTPHPSPAKAAEFQRVDKPSIEAAVTASSAAGVAHLIYISVAHPAPVMRAYIEVRAAGEHAIAAAGLTATILRPWYVLGPGHRWPIVLTPLYAVLEMILATRGGARRLGLVTIEQMQAALVHAVENPPARGMRCVMEVPEIVSASRRASDSTSTGPALS